MTIIFEICGQYLFKVSYKKPAIDNVLNKNIRQVLRKVDLLYYLTPKIYDFVNRIRLNFFK